MSKNSYLSKCNGVVCVMVHVRWICISLLLAESFVVQGSPLMFPLVGYTMVAYAVDRQPFAGNKLGIRV